MKNLELTQMEQIEGACTGFGIGSTSLGMANVWNPSGWVLLTVAASCAGYSILR